MLQLDLQTNMMCGIVEGEQERKGVSVDKLYGGSHPPVLLHILEENLKNTLKYHSNLFFYS